MRADVGFEGVFNRHLLMLLFWGCDPTDVQLLPELGQGVPEVWNTAQLWDGVSAKLKQISPLIPKSPLQSEQSFLLLC